MGTTVNWTAIVLVSVVVGCAPSPADAQQVFSRMQDPLAGSRVFGEKGCGRCHAVNGVGGRVGPDLARLPQPRSFFDLAAAMWNHLPRMAERMRESHIDRPRLSPRETSDLIAFLFTFNYFDPPGDVSTGRRLFRDKKCILCHQVAGIGGIVGPDLDFLRRVGSPILIAAGMWNHGPAMTEEMREREIERPVFNGAELRDLLAFLKSASPGQKLEPLHVLPGRAEEGERLFVTKRCVECHRAGGQGGRVGPDLAGRGRPRSLTEFAAAMWNKAPAMLEETKGRGITVPHLDAREMADLVAYLFAVQYAGHPGDPVKGRELLGEKGCLGCHSAAGEGGSVASDFTQIPDLDSPAAVISGLWNHAIVVTTQTPQWPQLNAVEMADIAAFLEGSERAQ